MSMPLDVKVEATLAHQRASSDCCGAGLDVAAGGEWTCRNCGSTCGRVLGPPETIEVTNG